MRKLAILLVLLLGAAWDQRAQGQDVGGGLIFSQHRHFRIPFQAGPGDQRLKQLHLFVSNDQGRSWQASAIAPVEQRHFRFLTDRDGSFWFAVQTEDLEGRRYPASMEGAQASLKVVVDTQPPLISLEGLQPYSGQVGVSWDVRDENLDLAAADSLRLEYRPVGGMTWLPVPGQRVHAKAYWTPLGSSPQEVRLRVRDRAGNWGEALTTVGLSGTQAPVVSPGYPAERPIEVVKGPAEGERRLVNTKRINLTFDLKEVGPSGISGIELWYTQDGRSWHKYPQQLTEDPKAKNLVFEVNGEGLFGVTLVAKSGVGLGERPPQIGDRPQAWIEVDMTRPEVKLQSVLVGQGIDKGKLTVMWSARDRNLHRQPIAISYAEQAGGPWTKIAHDQANTGRFVWNMPERVPYQFFVKVEALDQAGNVGEAVTDQVVKVDLALPKVNILNVGPAGQ